MATLVAVPACYGDNDGYARHSDGYPSCHDSYIRRNASLANHMCAGGELHERSEGDTSRYDSDNGCRASHTSRNDSYHGYSRCHFSYPEVCTPQRHR